MKELSEQIAADLLRIKAVFLRPNEPFTWASGIKSPIYCDNRLTLSDVAVREDVENGLAETIKQYCPEARATAALDFLNSTDEELFAALPTTGSG